MKDINRLKAGIQYACSFEKDIKHNGHTFNIEEYDFFDDRIVIFCSDVTIELIVDNIEDLVFEVFGTEVEISIRYNGNLYTYRII